jgi:hypothetical protein
MTPTDASSPSPQTSPSVRFARMALTAIVLALSVLGGVVWWTVQRNRRPGAPQYKATTTSKPVSHGPSESGGRGTIHPLYS